MDRGETRREACGAVSVAGALKPVLLLYSGLVQHAGQISPQLTWD